ncbi:beta strand repeat-containing protein [Chryseobacterium shigense]|uniref:Uncharacterized protein n=1 Tax=Chryseobacterium shigense TaxID=297244 RepID=A0A841N8A3_9FLAO|nr:thrombospondin type 3 repeat-containing protein [Chryseobacterium shigense]MBB6369660.1 hypothetical protein [Chryseobacterium shigense]
MKIFLSLKYLKRICFLLILLTFFEGYAQCPQNIVFPASASGAAATTTINGNGYRIGNSTLSLSNSSIVSYTNTIENGHQTAYGIEIAHSGSADTFANRVETTLTFSQPIYSLNFNINDLDAGDNIRILAYDQNNTLINFGTGNFTLFNTPTTTQITYTASPNKEFTSSGTNIPSSDSNLRARIAVNFNGQYVSRLILQYYDVNSSGSYTIDALSGSALCANPDSFTVTKGSSSTATTLSNDFHLTAAATTSNVTASAVGSWPGGITMNPNGTISVTGAATAGTYTLSYRICSASVPSNCSTSTATLIILEDTDGDGIANIYDLDDDNDGILDTDECPGNAVTNGIFAGDLSGWTAGTGWTYSSANGGTAINSDNGLTAGSLISQSVSNLNLVPNNGFVSVNLKLGAQDANNTAGSTATLEVLLNGTVYATFTNSTLRDNSNVSLALSNGAVSNFTTFGTTGAAASTYTQSAPFSIHIPHTGPNTATLSFRMTSGSDDWSLDDISINASICDYDNDGIPNHLDLDSDGDGCFDAIEGDENVTAAQLTAGRISGSVNTNGVPNLVNSGGTADVGGDVGQNFGYSQSINLSACKDTDGDGMMDNLDLDSDNDGILDTDEGTFCAKIGRNIRVGYLAVGAADDGLATNLLLNLNNYGTYGVYKNVTGVTLVPFAAVTDVTEANLISNNIDVFFVGSTATDNNNATGASTTNKAPTSVNNILTTWAKNTGKVIFAIQNNAVDFGYLTSSNNANPNTPSGTIGNQVYTNGYWPATSLTQSGAVQMTISSSTRLFNTLMVDANGRPVVVSDQEYNLVIFPDATIYIAEATQAIPGTDSDRRAIADTWAYVFDRFVSKQCTSTDTDGDTIPNHLDLDSDNDGCSDAFEAGATTSLTPNFVFTSVAGTSTDTNSDGLADIVDGTPLDGIPNYILTYEIAIDGTNKKCLDSDSDGVLDSVDLDDDNDGILDTSEGFACSSLNRNLRIGYLNTTLGNNGLMINMLSNPANFSYSGTFKKFPGITFVPYASEAAITEAQLLADNIDLFYAGSSANNAQTASDKLSTALNTRILTWISNNNKGAIILQNNASDYGYQVTNNNTNNNAPYGMVGQRVFTNGYWPETTFSQSGSVQMTIASLTNTYETAMVDAQGKATFIKDKNRKIVFIPDATIFEANVGASNVNNATLRVAADVWAYAFDVFLQGVCSSTDTDGDGTPNYLDLDADGDGCFDAIEGDENVLASQLNSNGSINISLAAPNNGVGSTAGTNLGVPNLVNTGGSADTGSVTAGSVGQPIGSSQNALVNTCICYEDPTLAAGQTYPVKHGITLLGRAGGSNTSWPMLRNSAYTALESKTKGFVITRNSNPEGTIAIPVVGMMVFDTDENSGSGCLKIYLGSGAGEGWKCFSAQGCP